MANEKRLIDANALLEILDNSSESWARSLQAIRNWWPHAVGIKDNIVRVIKEMPAVDAVEVVHGEWEIIEDDYFDLVELKCSVCGASYGFEDYEDDTPMNYHYCPNCGAKMDGDRYV